MLEPVDAEITITRSYYYDWTLDELQDGALFNGFF